MDRTWNFPSVNVPVLSKTTVPVLLRTSRTSDPRSGVLSLEDRPIPAKYARGTETTRAQGQEITRSIMALYTESATVHPKNRGITSVRITASPTTTGVYMAAKRLRTISVRDLRDEASSSSFFTREMALSPYSLVTRSLRRPSSLMKPAETSPPAESLRGVDSPVRADVSIQDSPSITVPSNGTESPGRISMMLPISTDSGETSRTRIPSTRRAILTRRAMVPRMASRDRETALF